MAAPNLKVDIATKVKTTPLSLSSVKNVSEKILKRLGWKKASLSILLVGDRRMITLNQQYLRHNWTTDVSAFPQHNKPRPSNKNIILGDLAICVPTAKRQSKQYGTSLKYELCFYICHGILHLMGYDDKTKRGEAWMRNQQIEILKKIGVK